MPTIASAPGKVHLIGEHAVVYGEPAIIAAIGLRTTVKAEKYDGVRYVDTRFGFDSFWHMNEVEESVKSVLQTWRVCSETKNFSLLFEMVKENGYENYKKSVVGIALKNLGINGGISVEIKSDVPTGAGVGSSSSFHVALVKAISAEYGIDITDEQVNNHAFELEKIIHGTPSGGDNSASCFGSLIWFQKATPKNIIRPLEGVSYKLANFVLVYTGPPIKTTGELVQQVRDLEESFRNERINNIGLMTLEMHEALKMKNFSAVKEIINSTQQNLAELGVSTMNIDEIASAVSEMGGAAKLCGAGGGGMMLCYHEDIDLLKDKITEIGYKPMGAELGVEGVRLEN